MTRPNKIRFTKPTPPDTKGNWSKLTRQEYNSTYGHPAWKRLRIAVLNSEPLCRECKAKGIIKEARVVDHIKPTADGGPFFDPRNMQPLCTRCHNNKSARESGSKKINRY